ncbi:MAG: phytase [Acidobacteria bacterium]|nr:phytase [Acidobacteriota bacterium]
MFRSVNWPRFPRTGMWAVVGMLMFGGPIWAQNAASSPGVNLPKDPIHEVLATVETAPIQKAGDSADDPAIWVNPHDAAQSLVIGTNKKGGLVVYDLSGKELQYLKDGRMNNVDVRSGFKLGTETVALVTAGNRSNDSIAIYVIDSATRRLKSVAARKIQTHTVYGSCMYRSARTGKFYYILTCKDGLVEQYELLDTGKGKVDARLVRRFDVGTVAEGCVADDELGNLYISEENVGIWKYGAEPNAGIDRILVDKSDGSGHLMADVEGVTLACGPDGSGYLIASSQGNNTYVMYRRDGQNAYVKTFRIVAGNGIDETSETDGIDVSTANLGPQFPNGLFVAQDGTNDQGNQNFKFVPWHLIDRK